MKNSIKLSLLLGALLLLNGLGIAHENPTGPIESCNALVLNGHRVDYSTFWLNKTGVLAIVTGDPQSANHKPVAFRVSLRRAGTVVRQWPANQTETVYSLQVDEIWPNAQLGDELIVEPANCPADGSTGCRGKQVLKMQGFNWLSHCLPADKC
ncbi:hypothetical protein [Fibrella arboris]|uniref:hypothetical protein n=1 Tax=Fibrella arboris TaxID=3242486 RepID=UPI00351FA63C